MMLAGWVLTVIGAAMALLVGPSARRPTGGLWPSGWAAIILGGLMFSAGIIVTITAS